jgi:hypothetical protein
LAPKVTGLRYVYGIDPKTKGRRPVLIVSRQHSALSYRLLYADDEIEISFSFS